MECTKTLQICCVSLPLMVLCLYISYLVMLESIRSKTGLEEDIREKTHPVLFFLTTTLPFLVRLPTMFMYSMFVWLANNGYRRLANRLTEWENHRTQQDFLKHRIFKILLFEVLNNFLSPFYIAFVLQDLDMLGQQVNTMLVMSLGLKKLVMTFLPYLKTLMVRPRLVHLPKPDQQLLVAMDQLKITNLDAGHPMVRQVLKDYKGDSYIGVDEDYLALFTKFGFTVFFIVNTPLSTAAFLLGNVIEWRVISYQLTKLCQRTPVSRIGNIGAWEFAFRSMIYLAVLTNVGLVYIIGLNRGMKSEDLVWLCIATSHLLLTIRAFLTQVIPPIPAAITQAMAQDDCSTEFSARSHATALRFKKPSHSC